MKLNFLPIFPNYFYVFFSQTNIQQKDKHTPQQHITLLLFFCFVFLLSHVKTHDHIFFLSKTHHRQTHFQPSFPLNNPLIYFLDLRGWHFWTITFILVFRPQRTTIWKINPTIFFSLRFATKTLYLFYNWNNFFSVHRAGVHCNTLISILFILVAFEYFIWFLIWFTWFMWCVVF